MHRWILILAVLLLRASLAQAQATSKAWVYAPKGLNLRAEPSSTGAVVEMIAVGEEVEIEEPPSALDVTVDGLKGGMAKASVKGKTGYLFSGYLVPLPLPNQDEALEGYVERAREAGFEVYYEEIKRDFGGYFQAEWAIVVQGLGWQEAFLVAKVLFRIPEKLNFMGEKGKGKGKVKTRNPEASSEESAWVDELETSYDSKGAVVKIEYKFRAEGTGKVVAVKFDKGHKGLRISELNIAD